MLLQIIFQLHQNHITVRGNYASQITLNTVMISLKKPKAVKFSIWPLW